MTWTEKELRDQRAVDDLMLSMKHPLKDAVQALRGVLLQAHPLLRERVKWNSPSYYFGRDMAAMNLHKQDAVRIVFVFHDGNMIADRHGILEGDYKDRRIVTITHAAQVAEHAAAIDQVVKEWMVLHGTEAGV